MQQYDDSTRDRATWAFERTGWLLMALFIAAAAMGLFGGGLLGDTSIAAPDGSLRVDYPRFWRADAPDVIEIELAAPGADPARVWLDAGYAVEELSIDTVAPTPERMELAADRLVLVFDLAEGASPVRIALHARALRSGVLRGRLGIEGGAAVELRQLVFP